jgi:hypothetical protein
LFVHGPTVPARARAVEIVAAIGFVDRGGAFALL